VSPDGPVPTEKRTLDYEVRFFLAQRLRDYCHQIKQIPVSETLSNLLKEIEPKTDQRAPSLIRQRVKPRQRGV